MADAFMERVLERMKTATCSSSRPLPTAEMLRLTSDFLDWCNRIWRSLRRPGLTKRQGPVRALPESWQFTERMAARMVDAPTVTEAGVRLIRSQNPKGWQAMQFGVQLEAQNREVLSACRATAEKAGAPVRCSIMVGS